jgi:hypothetical protein
LHPAVAAPALIAESPAALAAQSPAHIIAKHAAAGFFDGLFGGFWLPIARIVGNGAICLDRVVMAILTPKAI